MSEPAPSASSPSWTAKRYLLVGGMVAVVALVLFLLFWPSIQVRLDLAKLRGGSKGQVAEARKRLVETKSGGVEDALYELLSSPDEPFGARRLAAEVLLDRQRLPQVERALLEGDVARRTAALTALSERPWFEGTYLSNPAFLVDETLRAWLAMESEPSRAHAIGIAARHGMDGLMPSIRPLIVPSNDTSPAEGQGKIVVEAANAAALFHDCESVDALLNLSQVEANDLAHLRVIQALYRLTAGEDAACPEGVPEDLVSQAVIRALNAGRNTRIGALLILAEEPEWAQTAAEYILMLVDDKRDDIVRRHAMGALAVTGSPVFMERLPLWFHDEQSAIRSEAMSTSTLVEPRGAASPYVGAWISMLENETGSQFAFQTAANELREAAGRWVGIPPVALDDGQPRGRAALAFVQEMFSKGESAGVSRKAWAEAWRRWWAEQKGLDAEATEAYLDAVSRFAKAAEAGDAAGVGEILREPAFQQHGLGVYERGWLDAHRQ